MKLKTVGIIFLLFFVKQGLALAAPVAPRYVSLAPATTEILFALGLNEEIVGVSSYCNYPSEAKKKEKVGSFSAPHVEKILSLKPDIIFGTGMEQTPSVLELRHLNFNVYVSNPSTISGLLESIAEIGKLTNRQKEAQKLINDIKQGLKSLKNDVERLGVQARPKVFVEIWGEPLIAAGQGSLIDELIYFLGGVNCAHKVPRPFCYFSSEQVILSDPDCIIVTYLSAETAIKRMQKRFGWEHMTAVKNNRVFSDINPDLILRPGPRIVEGARELYKRIYLIS